MLELKTIDADTLLSTPLPVTKFIVEGLLPEGLHILAGSPKVGKSWLALWICLQVSKGEPVWGLPTAHGTALYLCLEDSYARIQNRLFQLAEDAPNTLHFANLSGRIGGGLERQITSFLSEHPDTCRRLPRPLFAEKFSRKPPYCNFTDPPSSQNERRGSDEYDLRDHRHQRCNRLQLCAETERSEQSPGGTSLYRQGY